LGYPAISDGGDSKKSGSSSVISSVASSSLLSSLGGYQKVLDIGIDGGTAEISFGLDVVGG